MPRLSWQRSLLPLTISVMLVAFVERAGNLAKAAGSVADHAAVTPVSAASSDNRPPDVRPPGLEAPAANDGAMLADLKRRRDALDKRSASLDEREELVAAAEQKLQTRLDQLAALQARLEQAEQQRHQRVDANWGGLVKTYEAMKPEEAAAIFNVLDTDVLLELFDRMNERKEAQMLAAMLPERARQVTQLLARRRVREEDAGDGQQGGQHG